MALKKYVILVTVPAALAVGAIALGAFNFLTDDGSVTGVAIKSLVVYWALEVLAGVLVSLAIRRTSEFVLSVATLLVVFVVAETAVRVASLDRAKRPFIGMPSSTVHHIYAPNVEMYMGVYEGNSVVVRTNEDGIRSDYSREEYLKYEHRIMMLGDSFAIGLGVRQDSMFTAVAERILRKETGNDDVAVISGSIVSYSPLLSRQIFRHRLKAYKPTVVMQILDATDIGDDFNYSRQIATDGEDVRFKLPDGKAPLVNSRIYNLASPFLGPVMDGLTYPYNKLMSIAGREDEYYTFNLEIDGVAEWNRFFIFRHPLEKTRPYFERTFANIRGLAADVAAAGATYVLVVTPRYQHWSKRECAENRERDNGYYKEGEPYEFEYFRFFDEMREEVDFDIYNMLPVFQQTDEFPLVFIADPHWNENGHRFVGERLSDYLVEHELVE